MGNYRQITSRRSVPLVPRRDPVARIVMLTKRFSLMNLAPNLALLAITLLIGGISLLNRFLLNIRHACLHCNFPDGRASLTPR